MKVTRTERSLVRLYRKNRVDRSYDFCAEQTLPEGGCFFGYGATPRQARLNLQEIYRHDHTWKPSWLISQEIQRGFRKIIEENPDIFNLIIPDNETR